MGVCTKGSCPGFCASGKFCEYHKNYNNVSAQRSKIKKAKKTGWLDKFNTLSRKRDELTTAYLKDYPHQRAVVIAEERATTLAVTDSESLSVSLIRSVTPSVTNKKRTITQVDGTVTVEEENTAATKTEEQVVETVEKMQRRERTEKLTRTVTTLLEQSIDVLLYRTELKLAYDEVPKMEYKPVKQPNGSERMEKIETIDLTLGPSQDDPRYWTRQHSERAMTTILTMMTNTRINEDYLLDLAPDDAGDTYKMWLNAFNPSDLVLWPLFREMLEMYNWELSDEVLEENVLLRAQPIRRSHAPGELKWSNNFRQRVDTYQVKYDFTLVPGLQAVYDMAVDEAKAAGVPKRVIGNYRPYGLWTLKGTCSVGMSPGMCACFSRIYMSFMEKEEANEEKVSLKTLMLGTASEIANRPPTMMPTQEELRAKYYNLH